MNRIGIIEWFSKVEKNNKFQREIIDIWPVLKSDLFFYWYQNSDKPANTQISKKSISLFKKILKIVSFFLRSKSSFNSEKILYAGFSAHRSDIDGKFVNKFFRGFTNSIDQSIEVEYGKYDSSKCYENQDNILFLEHFEPLIKLLNVFVKKRTYVNTNFTEIIERFSREVSPLPNNYIKKIERKIHLIRVYSILFSYVLKRLRVRKIYMLCYYNIQMFGLVLAANKNGIVVYDVQHGSQGPLHPSYFFQGLKSGSNFPNTLPSHFWCWDEASAVSLKNWLPLDRQYSVQNRGNPWIDYSIRRHNTDFKKSVEGKQYIILITLQEPILSETLLKAIEDLDSERFVWWLRFHPRMMEKREYWKEYFLTRNVENVEIDRACETPLPVLLNNAFLHISRYSGSIIEGCLLGVRTLITDEIGIETYGYYIDNEKVFNAVNLNSKELLDLIEKFDTGI